MAKRHAEHELVSEQGETFRRTEDNLWVPYDCEDERLSLAKRNVHEQDKKIHFRARDHKYFYVGATPKETLENSRGYVSVTGLYHKYCEDFDAAGTAQRMINSWGFPNKKPEHKKYQELLKDLPKSAWYSAILVFWEENGKKARDHGTLVHRELELLLNSPVWWEAPAGARKEVVIAAKFLADYRAKGWQPYRTELILVLPELKISGSADFFLQRVDKPDELLLGDWKCIVALNLFCPWNHFMKEPFIAFPDKNCWHYSIQPCLYRAILHWGNRYGKRVVEMIIVDVHESQDECLVMHVEDQNDFAMRILAERAKEVGYLL